MAENMQATILRRMLGQQAEDEGQSPLTSSRAVRMALTKAANDAGGLVATVNSVAEVVQSLDDMQYGLAEGLMLVDLQRQAQSVGLIALDMQMRAAILEMQTVGQVSKQAAEDRSATRTDKIMCEPFLDALLTTLPQAVTGTAFEGWLDAITPHQMVASARAAGLVLDDRDYRVLRLIVDLGVADREGCVLIALPLSAQKEQPVLDVVDDVDWDTAFHASVGAVEAVLNAELHRFQLPLSKADNLEVGDVLPLAGCTVSSVRLRALDGKLVRQAKLGQLGGKRAVRVERQAPPLMGELGARRAGQIARSVAANPMPEGEGAQSDVPLVGAIAE